MHTKVLARFNNKRIEKILMPPSFTPDNQFLEFLLFSLDEDKIDEGSNELVNEMRKGNPQVKELYTYLREYLDKEFEKYKNREF